MADPVTVVTIGMTRTSSLIDGQWSLSCCSRRCALDPFGVPEWAGDSFKRRGAGALPSASAT